MLAIENAIEFARVMRSPLHGRTWVPLIDGTDNLTQAHAGPLRMVEQFAEDESGAPPEAYWSRLSADEYVLLVMETDT